MLKQVLVPDIGSATGVNVIELLVKAGDFIAKEVSLITLETDKATMEIPSPYEGKIDSIQIKVGDKVSEGDLILTMEIAGEEAKAVEQPGSTEKELKESVSEEKVVAKTLEEKGSAERTYVKGFEEEASAEKGFEKASEKKVSAEKTDANVSAEKAQAFKSQTEPKFEGRGVYAGPAVRRFARELGVDLSRISGSGRKGRLMVSDVKAFVKQNLSALPSGSQPSIMSGLNLPAWPAMDHAKFGEISIEPLSRIKKLSGGFLHRNWLMVPHVTQFDEADITEMEAFRKESQSLAEQQGVKLTPLVFIMKAVVASLKAFPEFNASLDAEGTQLILKKYFHIGVAVDTPNGLVVPVVREVDQKGLFQLAKELGELSHKARKGQLTAKEMQGSSFSISSLGGIGGTGFTPIVNVPDVAILGVSKSLIKPIYQEGEFKPCLMLPLSLSYDHRVIDGAQAARFTSYLVKQLSDIRRLLF